MTWRVVDLEITPDDLVFARLSNGTVAIDVLGFLEITRRSAILRGMHIQGGGRNTMGLPALRAMAHWLKEYLDVDELRIEGATRTSGAGPGRRPAPSFSGDPVTLLLRLEGSLDQPISVVERLRAAGLTLRSAYTAISRLTEAGLAVCEINTGADIPALAADLATMNVHTNRRRRLDPGLVSHVRARHGLSQREFSALLGIDIDTLRNWEQGRNKPDQAVLNLIRAFDEAPEAIEHAVLETIA